MDLAGFFRALFSDWVGWMSGIVSLLLTVLGFAQKHYQWTSTMWSDPWLFWIAAMTCFFLGSAHVWTIEHRKLAQAEAALKSNLPRLVGQIDAFATAEFHDATRKVSVAQVILSIRNTGGSESIVSRLRLSADVFGKGQVFGDPFLLPKGLPYPYNLPADEMLINRIAENPIPRGALRRGWAFYHFPALSLAELKNANLTIYFEDVNGALTKVVFDRSQSTGSSSGSPFYYPGVNKAAVEGSINSQ